MSHAFWQSHLGGRESAIGTTLTLRDQPFTVVGVTPPSFTGLEVGQTFDIALPLCAAALWDSRIDRRDRWWLTIMGRLGPDWTITRANEHLRALSPGVLDATIPPDYDAGLIEGYRGIRFGVVSSARGVSRLRETHGTSLALLMGLTALVLLITCNNLATLVLARASAREREIAVPVAIGASRRRLVSQMLIESLLLAAAGALLAVPLALLCGRALVSFLETSTNSIHLNLTADWRLASFVGAAAALTAVLFGLLPALRVSLIDPIVAMRHASRGLTLDRRRARLQRALVVGQIAISLVLIFSALLFVQTFRNLAAVDPGFEQDRTIAVLFLDRTSEELPDEQKVAFQEELTRAIRSLPGVAAAASSTHVPLSGSMWSHFFRVTGAERSARRASRFAYVSPGYFETLRIPIAFRPRLPGVRHRALAPRDGRQRELRSQSSGRPESPRDDRADPCRTWFPGDVLRDRRGRRRYEVRGSARRKLLVRHGWRGDGADCLRADCAESESVRVGCRHGPVRAARGRDEDADRPPGRAAAIRRSRHTSWN